MSCVWSVPPKWHGVFFGECGGRVPDQGLSVIWVTGDHDNSDDCQGISISCSPQKQAMKKAGLLSLLHHPGKRGSSRNSDLPKVHPPLSGGQGFTGCWLLSPW